MVTRRMLEPEISFVNLIDVTLVLLIIFMITAPAMHNLIDVELPAGKASKARISEGIMITVAKDGSVYVDREKIKIEDFEEKFNNAWKKRSGEPVYIRGDESVPYGTVMNVLGTVKKIGGSNVGLVVEDKPLKLKK
ncbi:MAG: biopolymer transporter ExbD [Candidatus Latescibacteria bacterium]|jgi:biopolymer transport protein TolR|nr:biopolymer transporter ExbD [Candidatus Latescibacterota bacterium]